EGRNPLLRGQGVAHTRLFLYRPGVALVIVDRLRSDAVHTYIRYLHLHPDVELGDRDDVGIQINAPRFREFVPRWTLAFADTGSSEVRALTIALDQAALRATGAQAQGPTTTVDL